MKTHVSWPLGALAFLSLWLFAVPARSEDLDLELSPLRSSYVAGEPMLLKLTLRNTSDREVTIEYRYPHVGLTLSCAAADAVPPPPFWEGVEVIIRSKANTITLAPGAEHVTTPALNRHLILTKAKRYTIDYHARYREQSVTRPRTFRTHEASGTFELDITEGALPPDALNRLIKTFEAATGTVPPQPGPPRFRGVTPLALREATEALLWTDNTAVIPHLKAAAELCPAYGQDIVAALVRFLPAEEARSALLDVAVSGSSLATEAFLHLDRKKTIIITDQEYGALLRDPVAKYAASAYLGKKRTKEAGRDGR